MNILKYKYNFLNDYLEEHHSWYRKTIDRNQQEDQDILKVNTRRHFGGVILKKTIYYKHNIVQYNKDLQLI